MDERLPRNVQMDPAAVQKYAEGPPRFMPGYADMQRMATILLREYAGPEAEILALGAGRKGWSFKVFAGMQPG